MKKLLALILSCILVFGLSACSSTDTDSSDDDTSSTDTASSTDDDTVYEFTMSMHDSAESFNGQMVQAVLDEIYEKTDGHVKITLYASATLASSYDVGDFVLDGGCDLGWIFTTFYSGQYPLTDVITNPLIGTESSVQSTNVSWDLYETYSEMADEWSQYKVLQLYSNPVNYIFSTIPISSMDDLSGVSTRVTSGPIADCIAGWGGNGISLSTTELYDSFSKNNIQAAVLDPTVIVNFSLTELITYMTDLPIYNGTFAIVMNWDSYNSLPEEYQAVLDEYSTREASLALAEQVDASADETIDELVEGGMELVEVSDEAYDEFKAVADDVAADWIEENTSDDFDAQAYYDFAMEAFESYTE